MNVSSVISITVNCVCGKSLVYSQAKIYALFNKTFQSGEILLEKFRCKMPQG